MTIRQPTLILLLAALCLAAAEPGERAEYLCIGQGVDGEGKKSASAEGRVRLRLAQGLKFDDVKDKPVKATVFISGLVLHDTRGRTERMPSGVTFTGEFEIGKEFPYTGHNFRGKGPRGSILKDIHLNLSNSTRYPSVLQVRRGKETLPHHMLCQWE